jgi:hypothetical protein
MQRRWKTVDAYSDYQVSNLGEVKNTKTNRVLTHIDNGAGYKQVILGEDRKHYLVHRLVAESFLKNSKNYDYVVFKDGDRTNICSKNLKWVEDFHVYHKDIAYFGNPSVPVIQLNDEGKKVKIYDSIRKASYALDGTYNLTTQIGKVCRGLGKTCAGYEWRYA